MPKSIKLYRDKLQARVYRNRQRKSNYARTKGGARTGHPWQVDEIELILDLTRSDAELAQLLERSVQAIQGKRWKLNHCRPRSKKEIVHKKLPNKDAYDREAQKRCYEGLLPGIRESARKCGYAIAVHGSMSRDLDLIATPWVEAPESEAELAFQVAVACHGLLVGEIHIIPHRRLFQINMPWRESENRNYIELSVTPQNKSSKTEGGIA